jgi:outer membrane protein insertion porin family
VKESHASMSPLEPRFRTGASAGPRRAGLFLFLVAAGLAVAGLAGATPAAAQSLLEERPEVTSLRFRGNDTFSDRELALSIATRATECRSRLFYVPLPLCPLGFNFAFDESFLNPRDLRDDRARIQIFYYQRGYREATVDTVVARPREDAVGVTFVIEEGRAVLIDSVEVLGLEELGDEGRVIGEGLPVFQGGPLNLIQLDATRDTLLTRLRNRGYAHAEIFRGLNVPGGTYTAQVTFDVYTGPRTRFGEIEIQGNDKISESVVRRMLPFREGDVYSREQIFQGQRNLFNLEIFRHADIVQDLESPPDTVIPLAVRVTEGNVHRVRTGAGWSTAECFNSEARWASRNFLGGARRLQLRGRLSNLFTRSLDESVCGQAGNGVYGDMNWLASAEFIQPWIFSPRNSFSASLYFERQSLPDVFVRQALGVNLGLTRSVGRATSLTFGYRPQWASLDAAEIFFCTSFLICDPDDIGLLQGTNRLSPVGISFSRDRSNRVVSPTSGYMALVDVEHASRVTGSDYAYERVISEMTRYWEVVPDLVSAWRVRAGWLNSHSFRGLSAEVEERVVDHPQKRFYAGGANSVRGFAQNQLGPRVLTVPVERLLVPPSEDDGAAPVCTPAEVMLLTCDAAELGDGSFLPRPTGGDALVEANVELRFPIGGDFQGVSFLDVGQVWDRQNRFSFDQLEVTPGFGVRYLTPVGPIRVDLAYRFGGGSRLPVVTSQIRPFDPSRDAEGARIGEPGDAAHDFVLSSQLAPLQQRVLFDESDAWSFQRFQLHFSIGQAF